MDKPLHIASIKLKRSSKNRTPFRIRSITWASDSHGLFDYESKKHFIKTFECRAPKYDSYEVLRKGEEVQFLNISDAQQLRANDNEFESLVRITWQNGRFHLKGPNKTDSAENGENGNSSVSSKSSVSHEKHDHLWLVIRERGVKLSVGDVIKLGRYCIQVKEVNVDGSGALPRFELHGDKHVDVMTSDPLTQPDTFLLNTSMPVYPLGSSTWVPNYGSCNSSYLYSTQTNSNHDAPMLNHRFNSSDPISYQNINRMLSGGICNNNLTDCIHEQSAASVGHDDNPNRTDVPNMTIHAIPPLTVQKPANDLPSSGDVSHDHLSNNVDMPHNCLPRSSSVALSHSHNSGDVPNNYQSHSSAHVPHNHLSNIGDMPNNHSYSIADVPRMSQCHLTSSGDVEGSRGLEFYNNVDMSSHAATAITNVQSNNNRCSSDLSSHIDPKSPANTSPVATQMMMYDNGYVFGTNCNMNINSINSIIPPPISRANTELTLDASGDNDEVLSRTYHRRSTSEDIGVVNNEDGTTKNRCTGDSTSLLQSLYFHSKSLGLPVCRICLCEEDEVYTNPLISPCKCSGSMQWVHLLCLRTWMQGRLGVRGDGSSVSFFWRTLSCELCREPYPAFVNIASGDDTTLPFELFEIPRPKAPYIILEPRHYQGKGLHVVSLANARAARLGRGHDSDIRVSDISVSRHHALLKFLPYGKPKGTPADGRFVLEDPLSKFGTLLEIKNPYPLDPGDSVSLQSGRTVLTFNVKKRWTWLPQSCIAVARHDQDVVTTVHPRPATTSGVSAGNTLVMWHGTWQQPTQNSACHNGSPVVPAAASSRVPRSNMRLRQRIYSNFGRQGSLESPLNGRCNLPGQTLNCDGANSDGNYALESQVGPGNTHNEVRRGTSEQNAVSPHVVYDTFEAS